MKTNYLIATAILFFAFITLSIGQSPINPNVSTSHNDNTEYWSCLTPGGTINKLIEVQRGFFLNAVSATWNGNNVHSVKIKGPRRYISPGTYITSGQYTIEVQLWNPLAEISPDFDEDFNVDLVYTIGYLMNNRIGTQNFTIEFSICGNTIEGTGDSSNNFVVNNSGSNTMLNLELVRNYSKVEIVVNGITNPSVRRVVAIKNNMSMGKYQYELANHDLPHGLYQVIIQTDGALLTKMFMHSKF